MSLHIRVNGIPAPQGSKRHVGNGRMIEQSQAVGPWREAIRAQTQVATALVSGPWRAMTGPVDVSLIFRFPRPKGHYGTGRNAGKLKPSAPQFPATRRRGDIDKLVRAVLDGITQGGAIADDGLVVMLDAVKLYPVDGQAPGADIWIREARLP